MCAFSASRTLLLYVLVGVLLICDVSVSSLTLSLALISSSCRQPRVRARLVYLCLYPTLKAQAMAATPVDVSIYDQASSLQIS